jgi:hypothetical protein
MIRHAAVRSFRASRRVPPVLQPAGSLAPSHTARSTQPQPGPLFRPPNSAERSASDSSIAAALREEAAPEQPRRSDLLQALWPDAHQEDRPALTCSVSAPARAHHQSRLPTAPVAIVRHASPCALEQEKAGLVLAGAVATGCGPASSWARGRVSYRGEAG